MMIDTGTGVSDPESDAHRWSPGGTAEPGAGVKVVVSNSAWAAGCSGA